MTTGKPFRTTRYVYSKLACISFRELTRKVFQCTSLAIVGSTVLDRLQAVFQACTDQRKLFKALAYELSALIMQLEQLSKAFGGRKINTTKYCMCLPVNGSRICPKLHVCL